MAEDDKELGVPRWQRVYLCAVCSSIAFCAAYALAEWGEWPKLTYMPYEREWTVINRAQSAVPSSYLGLVAWGLGAALVVGAVGWVASARLRRPLSDRWVSLLAAWALTAFALTGCFFMWNLWPF